MFREDTICAPATAIGSGAISVIRVSGGTALPLVDGLVKLRRGTLADAPGFTVRFGEIPGVDEVLVTVFRAPHSYTGEDACEISCHASPYVANRILDLLCDAGCRLAEPGEFTRRAFLNGKLDLAQAEAVADLIAASTRTAHQVALSQLKGGYSAELRQLRDKLVELSALLELELDFSEEDVEFADRERLRALLEETMGKVQRLADSFQTGNAVRNGVPVAIIGAANTGKSTLLNALLGEERAIVSDMPGTTRDTVEECLVLDGIQYRFIDTAGLRETDDSVEQKGIERSMAALRKALVVIGVIDASQPGIAQFEAWSQLKELVRQAGTGPLIAVRNKMDICLEPYPLAGVLDLSARTGLGLGALKARISEVFSARCGSAGISGPHPVASPGNASESGASPAALKTGKSDDVWPAKTSSCASAKGAAPDQTAAATGNAPETGNDSREEKAQVLSASPTAPQAYNAGYHGEAAVLVTNRRHYEALRKASAALQAVHTSLLAGLGADLLAEDLRAAISAIGTILGETITPDEVLGEIFGKFCIGK
ncbi:MAG: tRNA uridine-5-carboxymethylaminomethyl(34) synthesis GTPase MnmE [Bacteroidales bacterium]|nr:tRNA uridine-5-carboxymethylaminomethyl(34) synthesis GTPase MnmE [Bacteroidales bacterium]